jgi:hypothetical protein
MDQKDNGTRKNWNKMGTGIILGTGIGVAIGVAMDNIAIGIAVGVAVGIALGAAWQNQARKDNNNQDEE